MGETEDGHGRGVTRRECVRARAGVVWGPAFGEKKLTSNHAVQGRGQYAYAKGSLNRGRQKTYRLETNVAVLDDINTTNAWIDVSL